MSYRLLNALDRLEGNPNKLTRYYNRPTVLEFFEEIIACGIEIASTNPKNNYELFFEYNQALLRIPSTNYCQCIVTYALTSDDIITLLLDELKEKYAGHEKVMRVEPSKQCIYIYT